MQEFSLPSREIPQSHVKPHSNENIIEISNEVNINSVIDVPEYDYIYYDYENKNPKKICEVSFTGQLKNKNLFIEEDSKDQLDNIALKSKVSEEQQSQENLYDKLLKKKFRYFDYNNITQKCKLCSKSGHFSSICPNFINKKICEKCGEESCNEFSRCRLIKCFRCKKPNHKASECKETNLIKCIRCKAFGHLEIDCLIHPLIPLITRTDSNFMLKSQFNAEGYFLNQEEVHCYLCGTIDEFSHNKKLFLLNEIIGPVLETCPNCAGGHKYSECPSSKKSKKTNRSKKFND